MKFENRNKTTIEPEKDGRPEDEDLLKEVREAYDCDSDAFDAIRAEGSTDIKYLTNDPWPDKEKINRRENNRPMLSCDELNQYCNQVINEVREHPREIKISPAGYGATAQLAEFRENRIRAIQYKSDAQAAYITALENCVQRSYGAFRITVDYASEDSFEQEIKIKRLPDPDQVLWDSACKELDCSDAQHCFVLESMPIAEFKRRWPNRQVIDFSTEMTTSYPQWIQDKFIQVAEYWRVEHNSDTLVQFEQPNEQGEDTFLLSEIPGAKLDKVGNLWIGPKKAAIANVRKTRTKKIKQYITNGVEILEEHDWLGKWIPIVPVFGKELYVNEAGGSRRILLSLIRLARDPQMAVNYFTTCMMEAVGKVPKVTTIGYEGQFEGHEQEWIDANKNPKPYLQVKAQLTDAGVQEILPLPQFIPFDPPVGNLSAGKELFSRAIQTAIGMYNTSVGKHDTNAKFGKAIQELDEQSDVGSFHFLDNFNRGLCAGGRIINDLISKIEQTEKEVSIRKRDGTDSTVRINTQEPYQAPDGSSHHYPTDLGEFDVTISVGPNEDSQRDEATDFIETFVEELGAMPFIQPDQARELLATSIQLKQLGPLGDAMVKVLRPDPGDPSQLQGQVGQLQAQNQQLSTENQALHMDRAGRVLEQQTKVHVESMKIDGAAQQKNGDNITKIIVAMLGAKSKEDAVSAQANAEKELTLLGFGHDAAHDLAMAVTNHAHAKEQAQHQAGLGLVTGGVQHAQSKDLAQQQADLNPQPSTASE